MDVCKEELIERLYQHEDDWAEGRTQNFAQVCMDCKRAAEMLSQHKQKIHIQNIRPKTYHAIFIGRDSCGFKNNNIYCIKISANMGHIWVYDLNSNARCPYANINALNQNWHIFKDVGFTEI